MSFHETAEGIEDTARYCTGGYHPIAINDTIHNRYVVLHKLGYGSYSTVWLVKDLEKKQQLFSMKVLTADASEAVSETRILRRLHRKSSWLGGFVSLFFGRRTAPHEFVLSVLKEFEIDGPNGRHRCIITDVLGPTVDAIRAGCSDYRLPLNIAKRVSYQFAKGLAYIHSRDVIHGDLHINNVLFNIPGMKFWTAEDVYKYLGEPVKIPINDAGESAPSDAVVPMDPTKLRDFCLSEKSTIKIIDFGQSFLSTDEVLPDKITTPLPITAPEILLGKRHIGPAIDVWAFGCTLFRILGNNILFDPFLNSKNQLLVEFVRTMGKLPDEWWGEWEERANFFDEDGNILPGKVLYGRSGTISMSERLESVVLRDDEPVASGLEESEIKVLLDILERIFAAYEPEKRIRASEIAKTLPKTWDA